MCRIFFGGFRPWFLVLAAWAKPGLPGRVGNVRAFAAGADTPLAKEFRGGAVTGKHVLPAAIVCSRTGRMSDQRCPQSKLRAWQFSGLAGFAPCHGFRHSNVGQSRVWNVKVDLIANMGRNCHGFHCPPENHDPNALARRVSCAGGMPEGPAPWLQSPRTMGVRTGSGPMVS